MEKQAQEWSKWSRYYENRSTYNGDPKIVIGDVFLDDIDAKHAFFDIKNAKGGIIERCLIFKTYEAGESGGEPSYPTTTVKLAAKTRDGWTIALDEETLLRRSAGSIKKEQQAKKKEKKRKLEDENRALAERQRELTQELAQVTGKLKRA